MKKQQYETEQVTDVPPYSQLASIYDKVMEYIDYKSWVEHLHELCNLHGVTRGRALDISCGTGNTVPWMREWVEALFCTDVSLPMVREMLRKMPEMRPYTWVSEMSSLPLKRRFDLIINLQDSVNYYLDSSRIVQHFSSVYEYLNPGGIYIFDFSTEQNIRRNFADLHEIYEDDYFGYERLNRYNPRTHLNTTEFLIWKLRKGEKQYFKELHTQRMYSAGDFKQMIDESPFQEWRWYQDETTKTPQKSAERIHVVARKKSR